MMADQPSTKKSSRKEFPGIDRRKFSLGMMMTPLGLAIPNVLAAQEKGGPQTEPFPSDQPTPPKLKRWMIYEDEHFSKPLEFNYAAITPRVVPFAFGDVRLIEGSRFTQSRDWSRDYMLRMDVDRMLHTFRLNAGLPSSAKPLGGWEAPTDQLRGCWAGHFLTASSFLIAGTGDAECKARAEKVVAVLAECQAKINQGGYLAAFPANEFEKLADGHGAKVPFYTLNMLMAGLIDMNVNVGNQQALEVVKGIAAWVDAWTAQWSEDRMQAILNEEFGGMGESLYNLAAITGDERWGRVGDRFQKKIFLRPLLNRCDELEGLHANTHLAQITSAALRYEVTGDYRFRELCLFFWETITEARMYATGGTSTMERWVTHANHLAQEIESSTENAECCCAYNMMRFTRHLYSWQPDIRYAEYYERTFLNHRMGTIQPETGLTTYVLSLAPGAWKTLCTEEDTFWCCNGTAIEEFARLQSSVYFHDADSLYVNLYVPTVLNWKEKGVTLKQETRFPDEPRTKLRITEASGARWTLRLRVPSWTNEDAQVSVNGTAIDITPAPGSYVNLTRKWKAGDTVELTMPMRLTRERLPDDPSMQAFRYGPIVLAAQFSKSGLPDSLVFNHEEPIVRSAPAVFVPALKESGSKLEDWLIPVDGQPMTYTVKGVGGETVTLKPLNLSWDRFAAYLRVV
jgi:uncharacterized protein